MNPAAYNASLKPLRFASPGGLILTRYTGQAGQTEEVVLQPSESGFPAFDANGNPVTLTAEQMVEAAGAQPLNANLTALAQSYQVALGRSWKKLHQITAGTTSQLRILVLGDSVAWDYGKAPYIAANLRSMYGSAGSTGAPYNIAYAGGAALVTGGFSFDATGDYYSLPSGGTITFGASSSFGLYSNAIFARWVKESGAGTFKIQTDPGTGTFSDFSGYTSVDANNGSTALGSGTLSFTAAFTRIRFVGLSGTVKILSPLFRLTTFSGVEVFNMSKGGAALSSIISSGQMLTDTIAGIQPDLIFFEAKESVAEMTTNLPTLVSLVQAGYSSAEWCMFGSPPRASGDQLGENAVVASVAEDNGFFYWDHYPVYGSYALMNAVGDDLDGVHPQPWASTRGASLAMHAMGFTQPPSSVTNGVSGANGFVGGALRSLFSNSGTDAVFTDYVGSAPALRFFKTTGTTGQYYETRFGPNASNLPAIFGANATGSFNSTTVREIISFVANGGTRAQIVFSLNGTAGSTITSGSGSPEGVLSAPVGSLYSRTDGGAGTSFYVKESGTGNTGWVAK